MINITVAFAALEKQVEIPLQVEPSCNVAVAIKRSGILEQFPEILYPDISVGIFSRKVNLDAGLSEGDRVEIYRPLEITPMQARRLRAKRLAK